MWRCAVIGMWRIIGRRENWVGCAAGRFIKTGGDAVKIELTEKEKAAIEQGLNRRGATEVVVKVENGRVVVLQVERKRVTIGA